MGRKHKNRGAQPHHRPGTSPPAAKPQSPAVVAQLAPTPPQVEELELLEAAADEVKPEELPFEPAPGAPSFGTALQRAWDAQRTFAKAKEAYDHAASELRKKEIDFERERGDAERTSKRDKADFDRQLEKLAEREAQVGASEARLGAEREALLQREIDAENGFIEQRRRILAPLEEMRTKLGAELEDLTAAATARRSEEEAAWRQRLDERAAHWREEDEARSRTAQAELQRLADELAETRARASAELRDELQRRRTEHERMLERAAGERETRWAAEEADLEQRRTALDAREGELRRERRKLEVEQELLAEDRAAFELRVERHAAAALEELRAEVAALREQHRVAAAARDQYWRELEAHREVERRFAGRPEELLERLDVLQRENADLSAKLRDSLGAESARRLEALERAQSAWREDEAVLRAQLAEAQQRVGRLRVSAVEVETLRDQKEALETSNRLLEAAIEELKADVDRYTQADEKRNPMEALLSIDRDPRFRDAVPTRRPLGTSMPDLAAFAADLRHRIAQALPERKLYYSERDVRCFLGGVAMSRLLLLQGISGTGKTSLPLAFAASVGAGVEVVEVQAGWRDRQDLIGYFNAFHRHYYATNFLQALYRAGTPAFSDRLFLVVLDEVNLSRVEQFFADFLSALEQPEDKRRLTLLNDPVAEAPDQMLEGRHFPIPRNVWFVGTANHDETTTDFADKTYDRAHVMELPRRDPDVDWFDVKKRGDREPISLTHLETAFAAARERRRTEVDQALKWLRQKNGVARLLDKRFRVGWGNRLERDAERFVPVVVEAGGTVGEALDHLLSTKVLRKLRSRHDVRPKALEELRDALEGSWDGIAGEPDRALALIDREIADKRDEEAG